VTKPTATKPRMTRVRLGASTWNRIERFFMA